MGTVRYIRGELQHMADSAVLAMIPPAELARVRGIDSAPVIKVYGIGHEGAHEAKLLGSGFTKMQFVKDALRAMYEKIVPGTKAFVGHGKETNSHVGREEVGEIIGKAQVERDGGLFNMVAVWIKDKARGAMLDIASVEQSVEYEETPDGIIVRDVGEVTGVALGNSETDSPAFPGATLIASMQAFKQEQRTTMTVEELRAAIAEGNFKPGDIFSKTVLQQDESVRGIVYEKTQSEFENRKRIEGLLDAEKEKVKAFEGVDLDALKAKAAKADKLDAGALLEKHCKAANLNDKQIAFVRDRFDDSFKIGDETDLEKAVQSHVESESKVYREYAKHYGVVVEDIKPGTPAGDQTDNHDGGEIDYTDPAQNPAIPKGDD